MKQNPLPISSTLHHRITSYPFHTSTKNPQLMTKKIPQLMTKHSPTSKIRDVIAPPKSSPNGPSYTTNLFTNNSQAEINKIFGNILHNTELNPPTLPLALFVELLIAAALSVEFCFSNNMYKQIHVVAIGSPLGLAVTVTFVE